MAAVVPRPGSQTAVMWVGVSGLALGVWGLMAPSAWGGTCVGRTWFARAAVIGVGWFVPLCKLMIWGLWGVHCVGGGMGGALQHWGLLG